MHRPEPTAVVVVPGKVLTPTTKMDGTSVDYQRQTFSPISFFSLFPFFLFVARGMRARSMSAAPWLDDRRPREPGDNIRDLSGWRVAWNVPLIIYKGDREPD